MLLLTYLSQPQPSPTTLRERIARRARRRRLVAASTRVVIVTGYVLAGAGALSFAGFGLLYLVLGLIK